MLLFNKPTAISYISKSGDKIYPVVIDIKEGVKSSETLSFMTADSNTGILSVAFMEGETIYNIDGATVVCDIERPDGTDLSIGAVKVADGVVEVPLGVNGTSQPGMYMFDFKITRPGSKTIGVPLVSYTVTQSINTDEIVTQDDRLPVLNDLIVKIQNATSANTQATNECNKATQDSITATNNSIQATNNVNNAMKSINNAIASGTVDLELKQVRTSLNGTLHPTANDRINQMETHLLEATATTVETESNFTTVEETSNGYFEDIKLEGKTLVNLCDKTPHLAGTSVAPIVNNENNCTTVTLTSSGASVLFYKLITKLKQSTTYTVICKVKSNYFATSQNYNIAISFGSVDNSDYGVSIKTYKKDFSQNFVTLVTKLQSGSNVDVDKLVIGNHSIQSVGNFLSVKDIIVLEGDYTQNQPEYFEGLMSVGQDVEEVSVESCFNVADIAIDGDTNFEVAHIKKGISYSISVKRSADVGYNLILRRNGKETILVGNSYSDFNTFTSNEDGVLFYNSHGKVEVSEIMLLPVLYSKDTMPNYKPYAPNKKPLLYYNPTTETWEKPVLREWDTIEKHSDGKYYYHKRSEEVVLNGSESWSISSTYNQTTNQNDIYRFSLLMPNIFKSNNTINIVSDRFTPIVNTSWRELSEHIESDTISRVSITISATKLSTQDAEGFKAWLKANPTKLVYRIEQEEVYECTNIDLMTYSGETNYIINSGAISPKSLLKVHNNISNVVKILQEKVSLLENTFIAGLKSVLSGDMYSLATILYPEDFEQNDNTEQDIMVIPE